MALRQFVAVILTLDPPRGKNVELGLGLPTIRHRVKERPLLLELLGKLRLLERLLGLLEVRNVLNVRTVWLSLVLT